MKGREQGCKAPEGPPKLHPQEAPYKASAWDVRAIILRKKIWTPLEHDGIHDCFGKIAVQWDP